MKTHLSRLWPLLLVVVALSGAVILAILVTSDGDNPKSAILASAEGEGEEEEEEGLGPAGRVTRLVARACTPFRWCRSGRFGRS